MVNLLQPAGSRPSIGRSAMVDDSELELGEPHGETYGESVGEYSLSSPHSGSETPSTACMGSHAYMGFEGGHTRKPP